MRSVGFACVLFNSRRTSSPSLPRLWRQTGQHPITIPHASSLCLTVKNRSSWTLYLELLRTYSEHFAFILHHDHDPGVESGWKNALWIRVELHLESWRKHSFENPANSPWITAFGGANCKNYKKTLIQDSGRMDASWLIGFLSYSRLKGLFIILVTDQRKKFRIQIYLIKFRPDSGRSRFWPGFRAHFGRTFWSAS